MLGSEQDCFGGCTEEDQSYFGLLDEARGPLLSSKRV